MFDHGAELRGWADLTPDLVSRYIDARQLAGTSPETIRKDVQALKSLLSWCEAKEPHAPRLSHLLTRLSPPVMTKEPTALTLSQERELLKQALRVHPTAPRFGTVRDWPLPSFYLLCRLGLLMGLRPGELKWLHWSELHLEANPFLALRNLPERPLKTPLAATPLEIPPQLAQELQAYQRTSRGRGRGQHDYLFARKTSSGWQAPYYDSIWRHLAVICKTPGLNCQWLRHTCATRRMEQGWNLVQIRNWLRHTSTQTCEKYYIARSQGTPLSFTSGTRPGDTVERQSNLF